MNNKEQSYAIMWKQLRSFSGISDWKKADCAVIYQSTMYLRGWRYQMDGIYPLLVVWS
jgi:hypothetical protein